MGLIFNRKKSSTTPTIDNSASEAMLASAQEQAKADEDEFRALQEQQKQDQLAYKKRSQTMQGGGRQGLMYGANAQGVL